MPTITLRRDGKCADCGAILRAGGKARWYRSGALYGLDCHEQKLVVREKDGSFLSSVLTTPRGGTALAVRPVRGTVVPAILVALNKAEEAASAAKGAFAAKHYQQPAFAVVENARGSRA